MSLNTKYKKREECDKTFFDEEINIIKKKYDNYILVCCSFSFANYYLKKVDYVEVLKKQKVIRNSEDLEKFKKYLHYNEEALKHFLDAIIILAKKFSNLSIIVRPHPSENKDIYINLSKKIKNAEIKKLINDALVFNNDPIRRRGRKLKKLNIIGDVLSNKKYDTVINITEYPTAMTCLGNLD